MELHSITFPGLPEPYSVAPATESADYPGCYYRTVNGKTEWENPPMVLGVEYRTTERWQGKAVYTALIDCGALPNNAQSATAHNIRMTKALRCSGTAGSSAFPRSHTVWPSTGKTVWTVDVCFSTTSVYIMTNYDASADNAYAQVWYTKD